MDRALCHRNFVQNWADGSQWAVHNHDKGCRGINSLKKYGLINIHSVVVGGSRGGSMTIMVVGVLRKGTYRISIGVDLHLAT
jgi:hypothetical protein